MQGTLEVRTGLALFPVARGSVEFWVTSEFDIGPQKRTAEVSAGRFTLALPGLIENVQIGKIDADGRAAYCSYSSNTSPGGSLRLQAEWLPVATLTAYEDGGSVSLDSFEIWQEGAPDVALLVAGGSPVPLVPPRFFGGMGTEWTATQRWWIRAPGFETACVEVDHSLGGEYRALLRGKAIVQVSVTGMPSDGSVQLSLARVGSTQNPRHETRIAAGELSARFTRLPEGTYLLSSQLSSGDSITGGPEAIVDLRAGRVAQVVLDMRAALAMSVPPSESAEEIRVAIQTEIPACWSEASRSAKGRVRRGAKGPLSADDPGVELDFEWKKTRAGLRCVAVAMLKPGTWTLAIDGIPWSHEFKVDAQTRSVPVSVPPLVELPILCEDADTHEPLGDVGLFWGRAATHHEFFSNCPTATAPESGALKLRVAKGSVAIHARKRGYVAKTLVIDAQSDGAPVVVSLERSCGIKLHFVSGMINVYAPYALHTSVREIGGNGQVLARCSDQLVQQIEVSHPGMYEIKVAGLDPLYLQPDPIRVVVERGKFTDASVTLLTR
ncbi:MAG TPA: hypothetical protein VK843_14160 [Planctomycetota bacterium]|nr:hypothetical protein [Planctomycetota bacterium]